MRNLVTAGNRRQWRDALPDRDFDQELPVRAFPAHDPIDKLRRRKVDNNVIASPYQPPFCATRNKISPELPIGLRKERSNDRREFYRP